MEKNVMRSMELVARERMDVAQQLSIWGETCEGDVSDVTDKLGVLIYEIGHLEDEFVDRYNQYCLKIQSIRNTEASIQHTRDRERKIVDQIAYLNYKKPDSPRIFILKQELVRAKAGSLVADAQLSNETRDKLKTAFTYQFEALQEYWEKVAIIAKHGKQLLLELVDDRPDKPGEHRSAYKGYELSTAMVRDCEDALTCWTDSNAAASSKLSPQTKAISQRRHINAAGHQSDEVAHLVPQNQPRDGGQGGENETEEEKEEGTLTPRAANAEERVLECEQVE